MFKELDFLLQQGQYVALRLVNRPDLHAELPGHVGALPAVAPPFPRTPTRWCGSTRPRTFSLAFSRSSRSYSARQPVPQVLVASTSCDKTVAVDATSAPLFLFQVRHQVVSDGLELAAEAPLAGLVLKRPQR